MFFIRHPNLFILKKPICIRLGSNYGGWWVIPWGLSEDTKILSLGAGEDISFDIELVNKFNCCVNIYDPTKRAIDHFSQIKKNYGKESFRSYTDHGSQPVEAYPLEKLVNQISFIKQAVWVHSGTIKFYKPENPAHVSHSIIQSKTNLEHEIVKCVDILEIPIQKFNIIKLDIEGAEVQVISRLLESVDKKHLPNQVLIELDKFKEPTFSNFFELIKFNDLMLIKGFNLLKREKYNFTYYRKSSTNSLEKI